MELRNCLNEVIGGYGTLKDISDVYIYMGHLINNSPYKLVFTSLKFYNYENDSFENWIKRVKENNNEIFTFIDFTLNTCYLKEEE